MRYMKQKTKKLDRSTYKLAIYKKHFWDFKKVINKKNILIRNIYNINKIGFHIKVSDSQ